MESLTTRESFLRDILANPDDDSLRLIMADWLEEQGDTVRAEFIRIQVRQAQLLAGAMRHRQAWPSDGAARQEHLELQRRDRKLFMPAMQGWYTWSSAQPSTRCLAWSISRGFVRSINIRAVDWGRLGEDIHRQEPVSEVTLESRTWQEYSQVAAACPATGRLSLLRLGLRDRLTHDEAHSLCSYRKVHGMPRRVAVWAASANGRQYMCEHVPDVELVVESEVCCDLVCDVE